LWIYLIKRLFWIVPTLLGIITINFFIINFAPGGPIDQIKVQMRADSSVFTDISDQSYMQQEGALDEGTINKLKKEFGFDQPFMTRYTKLIKNYLGFNFGKSFYKGKPVISMIQNALPVSLSITVLSLICILLISIPLGIFKAVRAGTVLDWVSTVIVGISYAIPGFIFAVWLLIFFAGGSFFNWFPIRGLTSDYVGDVSVWFKITDYLWHLVLPVLSVVLGHFARPTLITKNSISDELCKLYTLAIRAKGATEGYILTVHCFKNALLSLLASLPYIFLNIFFYTTIMIEFVFSLNGLGYLGYEAIVTRDYPVMFATIYLFSLVSALLLLVFDMLYCLVDPRIDFSEKK